MVVQILPEALEEPGDYPIPSKPGWVTRVRMYDASGAEFSPVAAAVGAPPPARGSAS